MPRHRTKQRVIDMSVPPDDRAERARREKRLKKKLRRLAKRATR